MQEYTAAGIEEGGGCFPGRHPSQEPAEAPASAHVLGGAGGGSWAAAWDLRHLRQVCGFAWHTGHRMGMEQLLRAHVLVLMECDLVHMCCMCACNLHI